MNRLDRFHTLRHHVIIGACFRALGKKEIQMCEAFITENEHLSDNDFAHKANRWFLDVPADQRPSTHKVSAMWALVAQSIKVVRSAR